MNTRIALITCTMLVGAYLHAQPADAAGRAKVRGAHTNASDGVSGGSTSVSAETAAGPGRPTETSS